MFDKFPNMRRIFNIKDWQIAWLIFLVSLCMYTLTLRGIYGNPEPASIKNNLDQATKPFELSPERDRYILILSLAENKSFALSKVLADAAYPDDGYYKGKFYIFFVPGISIYALPFYFLGKMFHLAQVATYFFISLVTSVLLVFLFKISRNIFKFPLWISLAVPLVYAYGSTSWSYAVTLYQHQVTTFFILASFYAVWKYKQQKKFSWMWASFVWLNYGLAIFIDYPNAVLMLPVIFYFFLESFKIITHHNAITFSLKKTFIFTAIIFAVITGIHGYYNYKNFDSPLRLAQTLAPYKTIKELQLLKTTKGEKEAKKVAQLQQPIDVFYEQNFTHGIYTVLISDERGIFFYSPIFILSLFGILYALRKITLESAILIATVIIDICLYASFADPWGGWAFGSRYLIPSMAILSLFVGLWLYKFPYKLFAQISTFSLFIFSTAISLAGVLTTNDVPPKVEAIPLKAGYTYLWNFRYILKGKSSSFLYQTVFASHISLIVYYIILYEIILALAILILFIIPARTYEYNNTN